MNIEELFQTLSLGELSNLSMAQSGSGTIIEEKQATILKHANEALLRLYSKFVLKETSLILLQKHDVTMYQLLAKRALSYTPGTGEPSVTRYIIDTPEEPFQDDVIRILKVFNDCGVEKPLNAEDNPWSLFTPRTKTLQIPKPFQDQKLAVSYQAKHPKLNIDTPQQILEIPEVLEAALTAFIAANVFTDMGTQESLVRGQNLMLKYEVLCSEVEEKDTVAISNVMSATVFEKNGWR